MNKFKRYLLTLALVLATTISTVIPVVAAPYENSQGSSEQGKVIQIAIPDENGILQFYTGKEAQSIYQQLENETCADFLSDNSLSAPINTDNGGEMPQGMFTYKYRFVKSSSARTVLMYGKRIINIMAIKEFNL